MAITEYESRRVKKSTYRIIIISSVTVIIIVFAFIWEAVLNRTADIPENFPPYTQKSPGPLAAVQTELDSVDWVTAAFLPENEYSRPGDQLLEINAIVIHYVGNPSTTARQNRNYFAGLSESGENYLSSNFIVGLDGEILQCVPVDEIAYASNTRNSDTISIECCHPDETGEFTDKTYDATVRLTAWLCTAFDLTAEDVIRHYDITGKECPKFFVDNDAAWELFKADISREMKKST